MAWRHESSERIHRAITALSEQLREQGAEWSATDQEAHAAAVRAYRLAHERVRARVTHEEWQRYRDEVANRRRATKNRVSNIAARYGLTSEEAMEVHTLDDVASTVRHPLFTGDPDPSAMFAARTPRDYSPQSAR
jgi:hypothetical protein